MTALIALLDVTAKRGGSAEFDRGHDAPLRRAQRRAMLRTIGVAVAAEHVGQLGHRDRLLPEDRVGELHDRAALFLFVCGAAMAAGTPEP